MTPLDHARDVFAGLVIAAVAVLGMAVIGACMAVSAAYAGLIAFLGGL